MTEEKLEGPKATLAQYRAMRDREKVTHFLLVLNESYLPFRSQILTMDPVPPLGRIYQLAVQEESQRLALSEYVKTSDRIVLAAKASSEQRFSFGRSGHGGVSKKTEIGRAHV